MPSSTVVIKDVEQYICDGTTLGGSWDNFSSSATSINANIIQSDDFQGRQSLTIDLDSLEIQLDFYPTTASNAGQNFARVVLVYDTGFASGGSSPNISSVMESAADTQPTPASYYGSMFQNRRYQGQLLILREWIIPGPEFTKSAARYTYYGRPDPISRPMLLDVNVDLTSLGLVTKYADATATPTTGHLILFVTPGHVKAAAHASYTGSCRLNYRSR